MVWYLFLQSFGKNEFQLPRISDSPIVCDTERPAILIRTIEGLSINNIERLKQNAFTGDLPIDTVAMSCYESEAKVILVDNEGFVLGEYDYSTKEMDRLIIEVELMKKIGDER